MATDPVQAETSNVLEAVPVRELVGHSNRITSGHYVTGIIELVYEILIYKKLSVGIYIFFTHVCFLFVKQRK